MNQNKTILEYESFNNKQISNRQNTIRLPFVSTLKHVNLSNKNLYFFFSFVIILNKYDFIYSGLRTTRDVRFL